MALPEDVVLYDLHNTSSPRELEAMLADPQQRWFARARLAALAVKGMVAATWNPHLHPRGRDGRFINVWGWVRWLDDLSGTWQRGQVSDINPKTGSIAIRRDDGTVVGFTTDGASKDLYSVPPPKGSLTLPNPKTGDEGSGFIKVQKGNLPPGFKGGSNPGGMYKANELFGTDTQISPLDLGMIQAHHFDLKASYTTSKAALGDVPEGMNDEQKVIVYDMKTGEVGLHTLGDNFYVDTNGQRQFGPLEEPVYWYVDNPDSEGGEPSSIEEIWGEMIDAAHLISNGDKFYVKVAKSKDHAANELLANQLYEQAGVNVAEVIPGETGENTLASRLIPTKTEKVNLSARMDDEEVLAKVRKDFVIDAWLANWDVAGQDLENIQVVDGEPYRIDAGGAVLYRAQGGPKNQNFGPVVGELTSMTDSHMNPQAAAVFGGITDSELADGAARLAAIDPAIIIALTEKGGLPSSVGDTLVARRQYLLTELNVDDPYADVAPLPQPSLPDEVAPPAPKPEPSIVPLSAPSMVWDGISKMWVKSVASTDSPSMLAQQLNDYYESSPLFQQEFAPSWAEGETVYALHNGQLYELLEFKGGDSYSMRSVNTDDVITEPLFHSLMMRVTADNEAHAKSTIAFIKASEALMWERSITSASNDDSYAEIFTGIESQPGLEPEVNTAYPPQFKADLLATTNGVDSTEIPWPDATDFSERYAYIWTPDTGNLYRPLQMNDDNTLTVENVQTGEVGPLLDLDAEVYAVRKDDLYSTELLDAKVKRQKLAEGVDEASIDEVNPEVIAWLDKKKKVTDAEAGKIVPPAEIDPPGGLSISKHHGAQLVSYLGGFYGVDGAPLMKAYQDKFGVTLGQMSGQSDPTKYEYLGYDDLKFFLSNLLLLPSGRNMAPAAGGSPAKVADVIDKWTEQDDYQGPKLVPTPTPLKLKPPADAKMAWINWKDSLSFAIEQSDSPITLWEDGNGLWEKFYAKYGGPTGDHTAPASYADFEQWVINDSGYPDLLPYVDQWLMDHEPYVDTPGDLDPGPSPSGQYDTQIPFLNNTLAAGAGEDISFSDMALNEDRKKVAEGLIGKVVYAHMDNLLEGAEQDDGKLSFKAQYGKPGPIVGLLYVEDMNYDLGENTPRLGVRSSDGAKHFIRIDTSPIKLRPVSTVTAEEFKTSANPTLKSDGTITYAGQTVGSWGKNGQWNWDKEYVYALDAEHTVTGRATSGKTDTKTGLRTAIGFMLPPKASATKSKKASPAVKKVADDTKLYPGGIKGKFTYVDGTPAKAGDWVQATKGGGGFVGQIVGWPDQENHPGMAFAVDNAGNQKAVNLKTMKPVSAPSGSNPYDAILPNIFEEQGVKFADGKTPKVGQTVTAGKPGSTQVVGIVHHLNTKQGFVYILQDDGKIVSKTYNVTKVLEEPDLVWNLSDAAIAPILVTPKETKPKKIPGYTYAAPDGSIIPQQQSLKDDWLSAHPKRKLTKDGYRPMAGMRLRNKAGDELVVVSTATEWDANPNRIRTWNLSQKKYTSTSTTAVEVDHAAELVGYDDGPVAKVSSLHLLEPSPSGPGTYVPEEGSVVYRIKVSQTYYSYKTQKYRTIEEWKYIVVAPGGGVAVVNAAGYSDSKYTAVTGSTQGLPYILKWDKPSTMEKVAIIDGTSDKQLAVHPYWVTGSNYNDTLVHTPSSVAVVDSTTGVVIPPPPAPEPQKPKPPPTPPTPTPTPEVVEPPTPTPEPPAPEPAPEGTVAEPKVIEQGHISVLTPPPQPAPVAKAKKLDPDIPAVSGTTSTLDAKPKVLMGTTGKSVAEAAVEMVAKKDSKEAGSGVTYAAGDSDFIEDMSVRFSIDATGGEEKLVARFRLREEVSEDTVSKLVTSGEGKTGAWKLQGTAYVTELKEGDLIGVYVSSMGNYLKPEGPQHEMDEPTAKVIGPAVLIGKSAKSDFDLYRIPVATQDGSVGEVDIELRESASIKKFEYDPDAPAKATGSNLHLTTTAAEAGWARTGVMQVPGSVGGIYVDETGKSVWPGSTVGTMAKGTGGHHFVRTMDDGTQIRMNGAHPTEGGIGFDTTRRANIAGEVVVSIPLTPGKDEEDIAESLSEAMQAVGVPVEKQNPPSDEQLVNYALMKLVTNYHPTYTYRDKPITGPDDPRVQKTLDYMSKELQQHLGRNVTLDDLRIHTTSDGRMSVVLSPEVAKAIGKRQGNHHFHHHGAGAGTVEQIFASPVNGLMSTDERWSLGVMTTGQSSHTDMTIGSGDRVYTRANTNSNFDSNQAIIFNPMMEATSLEVYTKGVSDAYGRRNGSNLFLTHGGGIEYMYKRKYEPEQITFYVVGSSSARDALIAQVKARGVTHIGSRSIEEIIVTKDQAKAAKNFDSIGEDYWAKDIPITTLIPQEKLSTAQQLLERTTAGVGA